MRKRSPTPAQQRAEQKRNRKNALRLNQPLTVTHPTNHPGPQFAGCDERRAALAERKAALFDLSATAARLRHRPDKRRRHPANQGSDVPRRERRARRGG